jgi:hypothetical protein
VEFEEQLDNHEFEEWGIIDTCSIKEPSYEESEDDNDPETLQTLLKEYEEKNLRGHLHLDQMITL